MKYIDAGKLKERVTRLIASAKQNDWPIAEDYLRRVIDIIDSLQQEQPNNMFQWTGSNLQEVIDFTGKSPKFGEWFKSWDEFESYVHSHGDILKLFSEDGSHFEVPVGAWIVKTPDGHNVPSVARFIHAKQERPDFPTTDEQIKEFLATHPVIKVPEKYENPDWLFKKQDQPKLPGYDKALLEVKSKVDELYEEANIGLNEYDSGLYNCITETCMKLRGFIKARLASDEQPEMDLEKEIEDYWEKICNDEFGEFIPRVRETAWFDDIARHFYELGLTARKED